LSCAFGFSEVFLVEQNEPINRLIESGYFA
jgi:hypothetical protein